MKNRNGAADMNPLENVWQSLKAEHAKLIEAFKRDLASAEESTARKAWKHMDEAAGLEKAMLIVGKELGL